MVRKITEQVINSSTVTRDNHRRELDPVPECLGDEVQEQVEVGDEVPLVECLADGERVPAEMCSLKIFIEMENL